MHSISRVSTWLVFGDSSIMVLWFGLVIMWRLFHRRSNWWEVTSSRSLQTGHHFRLERSSSHQTWQQSLLWLIRFSPWAVIEVSMLGRGTSAPNSLTHQTLRCGWEASALPLSTAGVSRQRTSPCPPSRCQRCPLPSHCWPFYPCAVLSEPNTPRLTVTREEKDIDVDARPPKLNGISHFGCTDVTLSRREKESWANLDTEVGWRGAFAWPTGLR